MCEATAYIIKDEKEEVLLEGVDLVEPEPDGSLRLVSIFGEQKVVRANIKRLELVNHKIILEPA